jgi:uncharacterized protein YegP (UPF0339 family)
MENPKFQIFKSPTNGEYFYRLRAKNGEIVLSGEGYLTKQSCQAGIVSVKLNTAYDNRYDRKDSYTSYNFNLTAANGEIIGRGETYTRRVARETGIEAVKRDVPTAPIEDLG